MSVNGHNVTFTVDGKWMISRPNPEGSLTVIGYADTLMEVEGVISANLERIRRRLRLIQDKAAERAAQQ